MVKKFVSMISWGREKLYYDQYYWQLKSLVNTQKSFVPYLYLLDELPYEKANELRSICSDLVIVDWSDNWDKTLSVKGNCVELIRNCYNTSIDAPVVFADADIMFKRNVEYLIDDTYDVLAGTRGYKYTRGSRHDINSGLMIFSTRDHLSVNAILDMWHKGVKSFATPDRKILASIETYTANRTQTIFEDQAALNRIFMLNRCLDQGLTVPIGDSYLGQCIIGDKTIWVKVLSQDEFGCEKPEKFGEDYVSVIHFKRLTHKNKGKDIFESFIER